MYSRHHWLLGTCVNHLSALPARDVVLHARVNTLRDRSRYNIQDYRKCRSQLIIVFHKKPTKKLPSASEHKTSSNVGCRACVTYYACNKAEDGFVVAVRFLCPCQTILYYVLSLSVRHSVRPSVCHQTWYDILKTNEPILLQTGTSGPGAKAWNGQLWGSGGQSSRSHEVDHRYKGLMDAQAFEHLFIHQTTRGNNSRQ